MIAKAESVVLQPLLIDWRQKVAAAKKLRAASKTKDTEPSAKVRSPERTNAEDDNAKSATSNGEPDLQAINEQLPAGWSALWDPTSQAVYYGNPSTKVFLIIWACFPLLL